MAVTCQTLVEPKPAVTRLWWKKLAYRHKSAEFLLYVMFVSGLLLWDVLSIGWLAERWILLAHMLIGGTAFTVVVGAFWGAHRRLYKTSKNTFLRLTGKFIEWLLVTCTLTGFYLFLWGNTGNAVGGVIENLHFYSSWVLLPLVFRHAMRWSIINLFKSRKK